MARVASNHRAQAERRPELRPRIRIVFGNDVALGPGKIELLDLVAQTGSIREAASRMKMSYMRAWTLIRTMNACFAEPLVIAARGGKAGGGAHLTSTGWAALNLYHEMEVDCRNATDRNWQKLQTLLHPADAKNEKSTKVTDDRPALRRPSISG